jgi:flavin-binding protein dodecin
LICIKALPAEKPNIVCVLLILGVTLMLKVIEVLAESDKSWEDAANKAVVDAAKTLRGIKSIYIKNLEASVENGKIRTYRINAKISFVLD